MRKYNEGRFRDLLLGSGFFLLCISALACTTASGLSERGGSKPFSEEVAQSKPEAAAEHELFELLSIEGNSGLARAQQLLPSAAGDNNGVAFEQVERILQKPTTKSISLARVDVNAFKENHISMSLSATQKLRASKKRFETLKEDTFIWSGEVLGAAANSIFVVRNGNVTGTIRDENNVLYLIEPVGEGVHALTQIDASHFPPVAKPVRVELPSNTSEVQSNVQANVQANVYSAPASVATSSNPVEIDLLVAYTPAARMAHHDIHSLILLAIEETHQTYQNSAVHIRLNLVDTFEYTQDDTLDGFSRSPIVIQRRNESGADVAILIRTQAAFCGQAYLLSNNPNWRAFEAGLAFGWVNLHCALGLYIFAHEIGHIQGAQHNEHEDINPNFPYGHGYIHSVPGGSNNFGTVMSYAWGVGCTAGLCPDIPYFSNPNISYRGTPTGTVGMHNNARVLNETAANVANFRARPGSPECDAIYATVASLPAAGGNYTLTTSCTNSPTSYRWTVNGALVGTGSSLNYTFPANNTGAFRSFTVVLTATNNAGTSIPIQREFSQPSTTTPVPQCSDINPAITTVPAAGATQTFTASCTNSPTSYRWTVNGTLVSTGSSLNYTFPANNTGATRSFTVGVTATNSGGTSAAIQRVISQVSTLQPPQCADISPAISSVPAAGATQTFTTSCTNSPTSYRWTVNGTLVSTGSSLNYTFPANNTGATRSFTVVVTATNSGGTSAAIQRVISQVSTLQPPQCADISPIITIPAVGGGYLFTTSCTNSPTSYHWTLNGAPVSHVGSSFHYGFPGNTSGTTRTYTMVVTATNSAGTSTPVQRVFTQAANASLGPQCSAISPAVSDLPSSGATQTFTTSCTGSPTSYQWSVNGTLVGTGSSLNYTFPANNTGTHRFFNIIVIATNNAGTGIPIQRVITQYK